MRYIHQVGDLVHIPQSVKLIECAPHKDPQIAIPFQVFETKAPQLGVITQIFESSYVQVYCGGSRWSVKDNSIYGINK